MSHSVIETLPVELLEPIFAWSGPNLGLLQASDLISTKLSSDYIYNTVCDRYLGEILERRAEHAAAQTLIFASRWMTWAFFKSWIVRAYGPSGCLCGFTVKEKCFDAQWPPDFKDATSMVFSRSHLPRLAFVNARIPKKLLRGPWTDDNMQFLRFLLWITSMTVDWIDPEVCQVAIAGRKQAMLASNLEAVQLFNHNRRLGRFASVDTVSFAVLEAGCNRSIVYDTLVTTHKWRPELSWQCAQLNKWCNDRIANNDPKGHWLQAMLAELRAHEHSGRLFRGNDTGYVRRIPTKLDPENGKYDGGVGDRLVIEDLKWNQVSMYLFVSLFPPRYEHFCTVS
jgi:hypothetical protein